MARGDFFPINPTLDEKGAFIALSFERNASEMKPIPLDRGENPFTSFRVLQNSLEISTAANLGLGPIFSGSIGRNSIGFIYEVMLFTEKTSSQPMGNLIQGTRWGSGLRLAMKATDLKTSANLGLGSIAASVQIGMAQATYEITGIGISSPVVLNALPNPGDFNFESYQKVLEATKIVKEFMSSHTDQLEAKPFAVSLSKPIEEERIEQAHSVVYAMLRIYHRKTLKETLEEISGSQIDVNIVKEVYAGFASILEENIKPDGQMSKNAWKWLNP